MAASNRHGTFGPDPRAESLARVEALLRDPDTTEFLLVTVPTIMAVSETERMAANLMASNISCRSLVLNQVMDPWEATPEGRAARRAEQQATLQALQGDPLLAGLELILAPHVNLEVRGPYALEYFGNQVWV